MRVLTRLVACLTFFPLALPAGAFTSLSANARGTLAAATAMKGRGHKAAAMAVLESLLLGTAKIGVAPGANATENAALTDAASRAVAVWGNALADSPFAMARPQEKANVTVQLVDDLGNGGDTQGKVVARRDFYVGNGHGFHLTAHVYVKRTVLGRRLTEDELTGVVAHELGHLLGLDDDLEPRGLMGPFVPGRPRLEPVRTEVESVQHYRQTVRQSLARLLASR